MLYHIWDRFKFTKIWFHSKRHQLDIEMFYIHSNLVNPTLPLFFYGLCPFSPCVFICVHICVLIFFISYFDRCPCACCSLVLYGRHLDPAAGLFMPQWTSMLVSSYLPSSSWSPLHPHHHLPCIIIIIISIIMIACTTVMEGCQRSLHLFKWPKLNNKTFIAFTIIIINIMGIVNITTNKWQQIVN